MKQVPEPRFSVGLTGGIGCGKSTVANLFAELGASIIDTDQIAHRLTGVDGAAMPALLAEFGPDYADSSGALDRQRMRALIFSDAGAKARLEAVLHPLIRAACMAEASVASGSYLMFAVPLLIESTHWSEQVGRILVIDCLESDQIARVMARNGLPEAQVRAIMAAQAPRQNRLARADDIIHNDGPIAALAPQIAALHRKYLKYSERMSQIRT